MTCVEEDPDESTLLSTLPLAADNPASCRPIVHSSLKENQHISLKQLLGEFIPVFSDSLLHHYCQA